MRRVAWLAALVLAVVAGCEESEAPATGGGGSGDGAADTGASTVFEDGATFRETRPADAEEVVEDASDRQCGGWEGGLSEWPSVPYPADCLSLDVPERYTCGEYWFWWGLGWDFEARGLVRERLTAILDAADPETADPVALAHMYTLRADLTMAMALEGGDIGLIAEVMPDYDMVMELDPDNSVAPTFADSMDLIFAFRSGDMEAVEALKEPIWDNVDRCFVGNILSISGTAIGLPMSTGWPGDIITALGEWDCDGPEFCETNTWKAPFAQPGLAFHFAEAYARVGLTVTAEDYLQQALAAEGADVWPFRGFVEATLEELDLWVADFEDLGPDGDATVMVYANQPFGCVFCHAEAPPADLVPAGRLEAPVLVGEEPEPEPEPEDTPDVEPEPEPDPDPEPEPAGACDNAADLDVLDAQADSLGGTMSGCGFECLGGDQACHAACVQEGTGLSDGCSLCFADVVMCTVAKCAFQCLAPDSVACADCRQTSCSPAFEACAGIVEP